MKKRVALLFMLVLLMPAAYPLSIRELISKYLFSYSSNELSSVNYTDYMIDKDSNGLNDTLVVEIEANANGNFIFVVNVFDKNAILTNETNISLSGTSRINATFSSFLLSQDKFNYSIKAYNSTNNLKYRKDNIITSSHTNYEEGFSLLELNDSKTGNKLRINMTINSSLNGTFQPVLFLKYNNSIIYSKQDLHIVKGKNHLIFELDNATIKKTHYSGTYNISSLKIGGKTIKPNYTTKPYDFRDFARSPYIYGFKDGKHDFGADGKYGSLQINTSIKSFADGLYHLKIHLYDLSGNLIEIKNISASLDSGNNTISANFNGTIIYYKKLNGPYAVKRIELYENYILADTIDNAYTTSNYNFNDFFAANLPDISTKIYASEEYRYGTNNITVNITFRNIGSKPAFNLFFEIFDNNTLSKSNKSNILYAGSEITYRLNFTNAPDFEISAVADLNGLVDESNESNNGEKVLVRINKKPALLPIANITVNETDKILINLSASDPNDDKLSFSVNLSKFSNESNIFRWHTSTLESGNYTVMAAASDGYLNDSSVFNIAVMDAPDKDIDNDGINDSVDRVIGNGSSINTTTMNLRVRINNSNNLSKIFDGTADIILMDGNFTVVEFNFNFSSYALNLTNITIEKQQSNSTGYIMFRGLRMPAGYTKTLHVDRLDAGVNGICIKDEDLSSISEISGNCDSINEFRIDCDGTSQSGYICSYNSTTGKYKVEGLKHSGIVQFSYSRQESGQAAASSGSSPGSGGGGGAFCLPDWQCDEWGICKNGVKSRKCHDKNRCAFAAKKPEESEKCTIENSEAGKQKNAGKKTGAKMPKNATNLKSNNQLPAITGKVVEKISNNKFSPLAFVGIGAVLLFIGYWIITRHSMKKL